MGVGAVKKDIFGGGGGSRWPEERCARPGYGWQHEHTEGEVCWVRAECPQLFPREAFPISLARDLS